MHGLSVETYNKIKYVLNKYPECNFKLFGSRAKGTNKYNSDIDIALINDIDENIINNIKIDLLKLNIIYKIDFVVVKGCNNDKLVENIINEGVDF